MASIILGKGNGENSVWLGLNDGGGEEVHFDFSYPIFSVLIGRKRSFKSSCLRVMIEGLLDEGNGLSKGFLPKLVVFDPIGNLSVDRPNPEAEDVKPLSFNNIKNLSVSDGSLRIPFSSMKGDDILALLGISERCTLQRRVVRGIIEELGERATKHEFIELAREHAFKLPPTSQEGFETKVDSIEGDKMIVDDAARPLDYLKEYRGVRIDLSCILPSDKARADFMCNYFLKQLVETRKEAREEEIKYALGEPARRLLEPVCVIVDELNRISARPFFDLVRISGNLGVSVVLASQSAKDFGNPILGERDVTFCGKLVNQGEVRKVSALIPATLGVDLSSSFYRLRPRSCIAWNEHDETMCKVRLRDTATLHYGRDESVERFRGLYE